MKKTISESEFIEEFRKMGRPDNFSNEGLAKLFRYMEQLEEDTGGEIELDVISICCEYAEYNLTEFQADYGEEYRAIEDIKNSTTVIDIDGEDFIIAQF